MLNTLQPSMPTILVLATALAILAGCAQSPEAQPPRIEGRVQLVQFASIPEAQDAEAVSRGSTWSEDITRQAPPSEADPADYGANAEGERWEDGVIQAKTYHLTVDAAITTHTHGIVIYAQDIIIDGRVNARDLGASPNETGYATTRAATMALYRGYGETDPETGEPLLWGAGSTPRSPCEGNGGGYIILNAPRITLNGSLDAGSTCAQPGIVYLEGTVTGQGTITASLIIHRGAA